MINSQGETPCTQPAVFSHYIKKLLKTTISKRVDKKPGFESWDASRTHQVWHVQLSQPLGGVALAHREAEGDLGSHRCSRTSRGAHRSTPAPYCCVAGATHRGARVDDNARLCRPEPESQRTWWCAAPIAATTQGTDLEWHVRPVLSVFFVGNDDVGLVGEKEKKQLIFCFSMRFSSWGWWLDCDAKCQPVSWSKKKCNFEKHSTFFIHNT